MKTRDIAHHLAQAASAFPLLGEVTEEGLLELVALELGHAERLDRFCPSGKGMSRAVPRSPLLHIISGNTPHAGLQTLIRGLLVGAHNRCKEPTGGLPELHAFRARLPEELARRVEISETLPERWLKEAEGVVVFGSDETLAHFRKRLQPGQRLVEHGHRISFGVIFDRGDDLRAVATAAARDTSLYDQQGCLSPHLFFLPRSLIKEFGPLMAEAMAEFEAKTPRSPLLPEEEAGIRAARDEATFRAALDPGLRLWKSEGNSAWTVIAESVARFTPSCLNRVVRLIPLKDAAFLPALERETKPYRALFSTVGVYPCTLENAEKLRGLGASRITPIGQMQFPPLTWHHDGEPVLLPLVRWIDLEGVTSLKSQSGPP